MAPPARLSFKDVSELERELDRSRTEIEQLRREVASMASSLNGLHRLRMMRLFDRYRLFRHRVGDFFLRLRLSMSGLSRLSGASGEPIPAAFPKQPRADLYDVVLFSGAGWRWRFQRPQQLACQWAGHGHRVFFVSLDFRPQVNPAYGRPARRYAIHPTRSLLAEVHLAGPRELHPLGKRMLACDMQQLFLSCDALREDFGVGRAVCIVEFPFWTPLVLELRERFGWKIVYDFMDRYYGVFPQAHSVLAEEPILLREADLVVASARLLVDDARAFNKQVRYIPNAADVAHFAQELTDDPPGFSESSPVIGYFGALAFWFDVELVRAAAAHHPDWVFILIGSGTADVRSLAVLPNVRLLGELPYEDLPAYLDRFDACIIPFKLLPVTAATDPVKLYEYLAAGKPVVATYLPELQPHGDMVYLAENQDTFEQLIERALTEDSEARRLERKEFAKLHTWNSRFQEYHQAVLDILAVSGAAERQTADRVPIVDPVLLDIDPAAIRVSRGFRFPGETCGEIIARGKLFSTDCIVLVDEQPVPTQFISATEMRCQVPASLYRVPGCLMVSVIDQRAWRQSNRRVLLVEGV